MRRPYVLPGGAIACVSCNACVQFSHNIKSSRYLTVFGHNRLDPEIVFFPRVPGAWYPTPSILTKREACTDSASSVWHFPVSTPDQLTRVCRSAVVPTVVVMISNQAKNRSNVIARMCTYDTETQAGQPAPRECGTMKKQAIPTSRIVHGRTIDIDGYLLCRGLDYSINIRRGID